MLTFEVPRLRMRGPQGVVVEGLGVCEKILEALTMFKVP